MRKKILIFTMAALTVLAGCGKDEQLPEEPQTYLEPYVPEQENISKAEATNPYKYLTPAVFGDGNVKIQTYILDGPNLTKSEMHADATNYGIREEVYLTKDSNLTIDDFVKEMKERLKSSEEIESVQETVSGNVASISYDILRGKVLYPCICYIKVEELQNYLDARIITVDNTKTSETSSEVIAELLETIGLQEGSTEPAGEEPVTESTETQQTDEQMEL